MTPPAVRERVVRLFERLGGKVEKDTDPARGSAVLKLPKKRRELAETLAQKLAVTVVDGTKYLILVAPVEKVSRLRTIEDEADTLTAWADERRGALLQLSGALPEGIHSALLELVDAARARRTEGGLVEPGIPANVPTYAREVTALDNLLGDFDDMVRRVTRDRLAGKLLNPEDAPAMFATRIESEGAVARLMSLSVALHALRQCLQPPPETEDPVSENTPDPEGWAAFVIHIQRTSKRIDFEQEAKSSVAEQLLPLVPGASNNPRANLGRGGNGWFEQGLAPVRGYLSVESALSRAVWKTFALASLGAEIARLAREVSRALAPNPTRRDRERTSQLATIEDFGAFLSFVSNVQAAQMRQFLAIREA